MIHGLYTDRLLTYWDHNLHGWKHQGYTHAADDIYDPCYDRVEYRLIVRNGVLEVVDCWASGCCVVECCTAMLAELARGKSVEWLQAYTEDEWLTYIGIPPKKRDCEMLPLHCLKNAAQTPIST